MKCPNCGRENRNVARFCQYCGALLPAGQAAPAPEERAAAEEQAAVQDAGAGQPAGVDLPAASDAPAAQAEDVAHEPEETLLPLAKGWAELPVGDLRAAEGKPMEGGAGEAEPASAAPAEQATISAVGPEVETQRGALAGEGAATGEDLVGDKGALEDERVLEDEGAAVDKEAPTDEGTLTEGESKGPGGVALDETEAQELLVPFDAAPGEAPSPPDEMSAIEAELRSADVLPWRDEPLPADVLEPGTVIDGRYRVVEVLAIDGEDVLYSARDLQRCPQCGFDGNSPDQAFCASCGAMMDEKPLVSLLQRPPGGEEVSGVELLDHVVDEGHEYWVWAEPGKQTDVLGGSEESMRMVIGQRTHPGRTRELDEDSLFALTMSYTYESAERTTGLFVVADGMGGHEAGELASRIGIRTFAGLVLRDVFARQVAGDELDEDALLRALERAMQAANEQVFLERERRETDMGTTVTAALLRDWTLYLAHVGDCRAYRWGEDGLQQLTTDHSVIASMVASGAARPDEVYTHPHRSVIYRCVGDQPHVAVDTAVVSMEPGDRLVICCDGLWEMLREDGIEEVLLREADPQRACDAMVEAANEAGGPDNISVIVVQV